MGLNPILEVHETIEEMERAAKEGAKGIGEIVGGYNFFPRLDNPLGDDRFIEILDKAGELRLPLLIHSCWGRHVWLKYSDPIYIDDFATSCPDTILIIAHSGGTYQRFNEGAIMVARKNPNVYLETSWTSTRIVEKMVKEVGAEKIIFA
ncbi:amidohydrolase family protein, partial [Candidatus Bathyarchaeota archaeon]|nr:amidohydrolase family protein [Candidatus Bathyarchaeota archaeon]